MTRLRNWNSSLISLVAAPLILAGCYAGETGKHGSNERMKNAAVTIVTGLAAQQTYGDSSVKATVERPLSFNSDITGTTSGDSIDVRMVIPTGDNVFKAMKTNGRWNGEQDKYMFNWGIKQIDENTYEVERVGLNGILHLNIDGRNISGTFEKPFAFDYSFKGNISENGTYNLTLEAPAAFDWAVNGTISSR